MAFDGAPTRTGLDDGWSMQSSLGVDAPPEAVSRPGFSTKGWFPVTLPSTVLGGLVADDEYPTSTSGRTSRRCGSRGSRSRGGTARSSQLDDVPGARTQLHFDGINYRADVYLNGTLVAGSDRVAGAFRTYTFDVTDVVHPGTNALAVRVYPVDPKHDLTITWIDWSPLAPDHGMGIWHDVWLTRTGAVTVRDPQVVSDLPLPATDRGRSHGDGDGPQRGRLARGRRRRRRDRRDRVLPDRRARPGGVEARDVRSRHRIRSST